VNVICIAGMHRSGTSMIARMLNLCGLYLGEEQDLMPPHPDNPEGYWENRKFVEINDAVLSSFGGSWHMPPDPDSLFSMQNDFSFLEKQAQNVISGFVEKAFWGWKDPRNSITLPFWQRLLPDLKVIICMRNPVEVAQSLAQRDHFSEIFGFNLWQTYNQRLMTSVAPENRLITHYSMYFADPETELHRLLEFMNIKVDSSTIRNAYQTTVSSLKRNRATFGSLIKTGAPLDVVNLYVEMCSQAGQAYLNTVNQTDIHLFSQNTEHFDRELDQDLLSRFMEKDPLVQSMTQWVAGKQRQIELLDEQLKQKEQSLTAQLAEKEQAVQSLTGLIAEKEKKVAEKEQRIKLLSVEVDQREHDLAEIRNSQAWKFAMLLRRIRTVVAPMNSRRALVLLQLIKVMTLSFGKIKIFARSNTLKKERRLVRFSGLFDEAWYLSKSADIIHSKIDPLTHYLLFGGFERRDPSPYFDSGWYLDTYKDVTEAGVNPLVHYLKLGKREGRAAKPDQQFQISSEFQTSSGTTVHPITMFKKIRLLGSLLYNKRENVMRILLEVIKNPRDPKTIQLISHSIHLVKERLDLLSSGRQEVNKTLSETILDQIEFDRIRAFQVVPYYLDPDAVVKVPANQTAPKLGVHLHIYYRDLLEQCADYLNNIPFHFDLFVSANDKDNIDEMTTFLQNHIHLLNKVIIKKVPNRGRDLAPFIVEFGKDLQKYDFVAHIHTKKSPHNSQLDTWFEDILDTLLGSQSGIHQIINLLSGDAKFVYPAPNEKILIDKSGWADNYDIAKKLLPQLLGEKIEAYPLIEFPQGSMFWAKSSALSKFLRFPLAYTDFPSEPIPADGTMSHVLERLLLVSANHLPGRNYRIYLSKSILKEAYYEPQKDYSQSQMHETVRVLSYYLPQFYPTPENDEWHGRGFTEWTKVRSANPLFYGHYQQRVPHKDLGYYSLISSEMLKKQVELMKCSGVYGQIFYHYWFTGKLILEKPAQMLLADKSIEMPFCFCWANENWTRKWDGNENEILLGQEYSEQDAIQFINYLIPFFKDERYIKIEGRPVLYIYRSASIPDFGVYKKAWQKVCAENGIKAPFVVAVLTRDTRSPTEHEMDAGCERVLHDWTSGNVKEIKNQLSPYWPINGSVLNYEKVADYYISQPPITDFTYFRSIIPSWDNTPRYGSEAFIVHKSTPEKFQEWLEELIVDAEARLPEDRRFVVVNAWNEWAESAVLEPDSRFGYAYLNSIGRTLSGIDFNDREYLHQKIPETTQVSISIGSHLLNELQLDENMRTKMFSCIGNSSILSICNIVFEQPLVAQWMSAFSSASNQSEEIIKPDYTFHIMGVCYFAPDTLENMLRMALCYDAGVITPTHLNDRIFTHQNLMGRWETSQISPYMFLLKNGDKRSTKCCVDAGIFISQSQSLQRDANHQVSTIIRFSQSGNMKLLQNALYSLMAQIGCVVQPIIAVQDLADDMLAELEVMLKKMPWDDNCPPIIRKYYSTEKNRDLRSLMLNDALKAVKTEYAAFLDYDDVMFHNAYSWLIQRLRHSGKNASFGLIYNTVFNLAEQKIRERQVVYNYGKSYADFLNLNHTPIHGFLLNMSKINLDQIEYYEDMKYREDYYLTLQIFTEDGTDWKSLQEKNFIGDYYHYEDKRQTLAILDQEHRNKIISSQDYAESEDRIHVLRQRIHRKK
jgi:lipopolysaccharide biosynthesis protein